MAVDLLPGDCLQVLRETPDGSVQCCVTSPPYYGLRDYGIDGQIGLEQTPEQYIARLVAVFREVRRVLKDDGTLWLNLGDSYSTGADNKQAGGNIGMSRIQDDSALGTSEKGWGKHRKVPQGLKPKDLLMIPARVALALQADGWYLRSEIIWHKPNPMPESVRDRPTKSHEMIYLLAKNQRYFYDAEACAEPSINEGRVVKASNAEAKNAGKGKYGATALGFTQHDTLVKPTRNRRDVWTVTTKPYKEAHFATFPPDLIEPCILAGTSERGECPRCGRAWVRVVEKEAIIRPRPNSLTESRFVNHKGRRGTPNDYGGTNVTTTGWRPSCSCIDESDRNGPFEPVPQTVIDPFNGSGTTGAVSVMHGRNYIGIELNPEYITLSQKRINGTQIKI